MSVNFRNFARVGVILAVIFLTSGRAKAANHFIDYVGGADSNNGTSTNSPWQHCPGDPSATGNAGAATLAAGDTVFFKGGVSYVLTAVYTSAPCTAGIALKWNGAVNNPITYDGNSAGNWGSGRAVITDNCTTNNIVAFYNYGNISNLSFKNIEIGPIGGSQNLPPDPGYALPPNPGAGIATGGSMNGVTIDGFSYFHNLGYWYNQSP